jgi:GrpB-like predicted nucleotidyltransferase (UPF0157 family)
VSTQGPAASSKEDEVEVPSKKKHKGDRKGKSRAEAPKAVSQGEPPLSLELRKGLRRYLKRSQPKLGPDARKQYTDAACEMVGRELDAHGQHGAGFTDIYKVRIAGWGGGAFMCLGWVT